MRDPTYLLLGGGLCGALLSLGCGGEVEIVPDTSETTGTMGAEDTGSGGEVPADTSTGDGDTSAGDGDGDGDTSAGDGDGDGDGDTSAGDGDGDGDTSAGDGDGDGDGDGCGDGIVQSGEACDDGNAVDGDGCNNDCGFSGQLLTSQAWVTQGAASLYDVCVASPDERVTVGTTVDAGATGLMVRTNPAWAWTEQVSLDISLNDEYALVGALADDMSTYVGGRVRDASLDDHPWLSRVAADGAVLWTVFPADSTLAPAEVRGIAPNHSLGAFVVGVRTDPLLTATERWVARVDGLGNTQWAQVEDSGHADDAYHDVLVGPAGTVYAVGSVGTASARGDLLVAAFDQGGVPQWTWQHDHLGGHDALTAIGLNHDGALVVAGTVEAAPGDTDILLAAIDIDGATLWIDVFDGGGNNDRIHDLAVDQQGKTVLAGSVCTPVYEACPTLHVRKHGADGAVMWARTGAATAFSMGTSEARGVAIDSDNHILLVGSARATLTEEMQAWLGSMSP